MLEVLTLKLNRFTWRASRLLWHFLLSLFLYCFGYSETMERHWYYRNSNLHIFNSAFLFVYIDFQLVYEAALSKLSAIDDLITVGRHMSDILSTHLAKKLLKAIKQTTISCKLMETSFQRRVQELKKILQLSGVDVRWHFHAISDIFVAIWLLRLNWSKIGFLE